MKASSGPQYEYEGTEALQRQIELLKYYPEIFEKYFYPAMVEAAEATKSGVRPRLPVHTGRLDRALGSKVIHGTSNALSSRLGKDSALGTRAEIGFGARYKMPSARYAAALDKGAGPHEIAGRNRADGNLRFSSGDRFTAIGSLQHPGFAGFQFMEQGLEDARPKIDGLIENAAGQVVQELAQP